MRSLLVALITTMLLAVPAGDANAAKHGPFGLGVMLGDPTGLSGKVYFSDMFALDFAAGIAWHGGNNFHSHVDFLVQIDLKQWPPGALDLYFGIGGKLGWYWRGGHGRAGDHVRFGIRAPVGVSWEFEKFPLEIFLEVAPGAWFTGWVDFDMDASVGARWYF